MRRERRLWIALTLNVALVVGQCVAGFAAHSLSLLADAGHNVADVAALLLALIAVRLTRRPASGRRSFGWHRSSILAAQANAALVLGVTLVLLVEAARRLAGPAHPVQGALVLGVALVAAAVNAGAAVALGDPTHPDHDGDAQPAGAPMHDHGTSDLNVRAARLHLLADVATSLTVAAAGAVLLADPGIPRLDPAVSILVALVVSWRAFGLLREANDVLLESSPAGLDLTALCTAIAADADVVDVHDLHVWSLSSQVRALSAHLVLHGHPTLEEAQHVRDRVKQAIAEPFAIAHATLELECEEACQPDPVTACALGNDSAQSAQLAEPAEPAEPAGSAESVRSARSAESVR